MWLQSRVPLVGCSNRIAHQSVRVNPKVKKQFPGVRQQARGKEKIPGRRSAHLSRAGAYTGIQLTYREGAGLMPEHEANGGAVQTGQKEDVDDLIFRTDGEWLTSDR